MERQTPIRIFAWLVLLFFTGLMSYNCLPYFSEPRTHAFVWEKGAVAERPMWFISVVIHVCAGLICLISSFLQFCRPLLRRLPWMHRWLGRIYVFSILLFLAPTGFYLSFFAHGGLLGTIGFLILGIITTITTFKGWVAIRRKQIAEHVAWMVRSFAMVNTALTFRIEHIAFQELGLAPETGFIAALYLSISGNAIAAEFLLWRIRRNKNKRQNHTNGNETQHSIPLRAGIS